MTQEIIGRLEEFRSNFRLNARSCSVFLSQYFKTVVRGHRKQMDRDRISLEKPQQNCRVQQSRDCINARDDNHLARCACGKVKWSWRSNFSSWLFLTHGSFKKLIKATVFAVQVAVVAAVAADNRDSHRSSRILNSAIRQDVLLMEIRDEMPCTSCRNSLAPFYESKLLNERQIYQNELRFPSLALLLSVLDGRDVSRLPRVPIGLLPVIGGSIATIVMFAVSRARYTSKTEQQPHGLSGLQTSQSTLIGLLTGLAATSLLSLLELSLRLAFH
jgi:hypothetical protein